MMILSGTKVQFGMCILLSQEKFVLMIISLEYYKLLLISIIHE